VTRTSILLILSAGGTAITHALIPDHWLPFVLMARMQSWSVRRAALLTGLAGLLHVLMSIVLGAAAILLGSGSARDLAERAGRPLESLAGLLLVIFGLAYGILSHVREARAHSGGPSEAVHAHGHLLSRWLGRTRTGAALVLIVGISPCALLAPILFAAAAEGPGPVAGAALAFAGGTVVTMIVVVAIALHGMRRIELRFFTRWGDLASGLLLAVIGAALMLGAG
jgi:ABC-type nickel/cobalt efflux system permease component RcnA